MRVAEVLADKGAEMVRDGIHDAIPVLEAAVAMLRAEAGEISPDEIPDLTEYAEWLNGED